MTGRAVEPEPPPETGRPARDLVLSVEGPITDAAVARLCDRLRAVLATSDVDVVTYDVRSIARADATALEALARLQLTARRMGRSVRLCHVSSELHDLLHLAGLSETVPAISEA